MANRLKCFQCTVALNCLCIAICATSISNVYHFNVVFRLLTNDTCLSTKTWYLHSDLSRWSLPSQQMLYAAFPIDPERRNFVRDVKRVVFSVVYPKPLKKQINLAAISPHVLTTLLDMDPQVAHTSRFQDLAAGSQVLPGVLPLAHRYGGHQFGYWSGQLGDGRAVMLGEYVNGRGERWELQLKGSGLTPYSRRGDGRAVIRSSVREFLCSEAMHALGIPTSRAASIVVSQDPVIRDQFYNGNIKTERAAVVLRLAKSWFRFGSLEILAKNNELDLLREMVDYIINNYFASVNASDSNRYLAFFQEVVTQTADLIAMWQSVGFVHGVCNTDNFSILSITIDYGPFGFMEEFDPTFVPNTSDDEGRYSFENQPNIGAFNLHKLLESLGKLLDTKQRKLAEDIFNGYGERYRHTFMVLTLRKLGFQNVPSITEDLEQLVALLFKIMGNTKADFTLAFRELSEISVYELLHAEHFTFNQNFWTLQTLANHELFFKWVRMYAELLQSNSIPDQDRQSIMQRVNPRYILRNWIAESIIRKVEQNSFEELQTILHIFENPYDYNAKAEELGYASKPPKWARDLKVSCSS